MNRRILTRTVPTSVALVYSLIATQRSPHLEAPMKRRIWLVLVPLLAVLVRMWRVSSS
jgi:hypothetical protein